MCGLIVIAGGSSPRMSGASVYAALRHRGPDSFGYEAVSCGGGLFELAHTRLAIQDLSPAGAQPMWSANGRWLIAFNGEIYNHEILRAYLVDRYQAEFKGHSDTETLIELIAREGVARTVARLDGMFAFVVLDRSCGRLYAVRDAAGIKPLYYIASGGEIAFSSEIRGLTSHGFDPGAADQQAALTYLQLRYIPSPRTAFQRLQRVAPGSVVSWQKGALARSRFDWNPLDGHHSSPTGVPDANRVKQFGATLEQSVRDQLIADVPVGVLLSGGLDSAVIATALIRAGVAPPCFTVGFEDDLQGRSEIADARETARLLGLPHYALSLSVEDLVAVEGRAMSHLEEPLGTTSTLAMWHLCKLAREHVTVALAGQGADEPLGGYRRHRLESLRSMLPAGARKLLSLVARTALSRHSGDHVRAARALIAEPWVDAYLAAREVFSGREICTITGHSPLSAREVFACGLEAMANADTRSDLSRSLWLDVRTQLADDLLLYGDKISMSHSLEVRVPFLGAPLLSMMEGLPDHLRTGPRQSKRVLRAWAADVMPPEILARPKRGFQIPNLFRNESFMNESKERARSYLGPAGPFVNWDADRIVASIEAGVQGGAAEVRAWTLHSLARWAEMQMNIARAGPKTLRNCNVSHAERASDHSVV